MNRVRWLNAQWPSTMRTVGAKLKAMPFSEDSIDGFAIERVRDEFIEGKFIEKYFYEETISNPFGGEESFERIGYRFTEFSLFSRFPYIEIKNGQRSTKDFVNKLLQACNFSLTVSPIVVDLFEWVAAFQERIGCKVVVDSVQVSGISLGEGVVGKILLKGDRDVREAISDIVGDRKYTLEKVQIKAAVDGRVVSIQLNNNGTARIPSDCMSNLLAALRLSLPQNNKLC